MSKAKRLLIALSRSDDCFEHPLMKFASIVYESLERLDELEIKFPKDELNPRFASEVLKLFGFECIEMELGLEALLRCKKADNPSQLGK